MKDLPKYLVVGLGGAIGANARYIITNVAQQRLGESFPYGTVMINVSGSFLLGVLATLAIRYTWNDHVRLLLSMGFLGAFTTFSTFEYETLRLFADNQRYRAGLNVGGSVIGGLIAAWLGMVVARLIISALNPGE